MKNKRTDDPRLLGILGGMGPAATIDFMEKLLRTTNAEKDQDQIPAVVYNNTVIPDRNDAYLKGGISPAPELIKSAKVLEKAGCDIIAIPCNTAHIWYDKIAENTEVEILNAPLIVSEQLPESIKAGIICTTPVKLSGLYEDALSRKGVDLIYPEQQQDVMDAIYKVKSGNMMEAEDLFMGQVDFLMESGSEKIIAGCSEVPVALKKSKAMEYIIDPMESLARECAIRFKKI
ncbi:MAG: cysteate racemase [Thermoplasmataceae archaeon]